jgi:hypothetical protein
MRSCALCNSAVSDGRLFCGDCVPEASLRQDVTISLGMLPGSGHTAVHAREIPTEGGIGQTRLEARERTEWRRDRQRSERNVWLLDHRADWYAEDAYVAETGEKTDWPGKRGPLRDQSLHRKVDPS